MTKGTVAQPIVDVGDRHVPLRFVILGLAPRIHAVTVRTAAAQDL
jgi:hypothetical protein